MGFQANGNINIDCITTHLHFFLEKNRFFYLLGNILYSKMWFADERRELSHYSDLAFEIFNLKYFPFHFNLRRHRKSLHFGGMVVYFQARMVWQSVEDTGGSGSQISLFIEREFGAEGNS